MVKVDREKLTEKVARALVGPVNGDNIPEHKKKLVATVVAQTIDVLGEMGYLNLKGENGE